MFRWTWTLDLLRWVVFDPAQPRRSGILLLLKVSAVALIVWWGGGDLWAKGAQAPEGPFSGRAYLSSELSEGVQEARGRALKRRMRALTAAYRRTLIPARGKLSCREGTALKLQLRALRARHDELLERLNGFLSSLDGGKEALTELRHSYMPLARMDEAAALFLGRWRNAPPCIPRSTGERHARPGTPAPVLSGAVLSSRAPGA